MSENHFYNEFERAYEKLTMPCVSDSYESPISVIATQIQTMYDEEVMKAIQRVGIEVNKDELIKALDYDRKQYEQGYRNGYDRGYQQAKEDIANMLSGTPI